MPNSTAWLEHLRQNLEELDQIESSLAVRIEHAKWLVDGSLVVSRRIRLATQLDARRLIDRYHTIVNSLCNTLDKSTCFTFNSKIKAEINNYSKLSVQDALKTLETELETDNFIPSMNCSEIYTRNGGVGISRYFSPFTADIDVDHSFTVSENYGQFLDLDRFYSQFKGLGGALLFEEYLDQFGNVEGEPYVSLQRGKNLSVYMDQLAAYLMEFYHKTHLLSPEPQIPILPWYCNTCSREFKYQSVYAAHFSGRKHRSALKNRSEANRVSSNASPRFQAERVIQTYAKLLEFEVEATKSEYHRRLALTSEERLYEQVAQENHRLAEDQAVSENEDKDSEDKSTSSQPVGPDGRPMPRWLFKLNGLGIKFSCEICGNYVYHGRKAFNKHFFEARHLHGLRCLGITPSASYNGIATISEALHLQALSRKHQVHARRLFDPEVEDSDGNVMLKRVYDDLRRQGLL